MKFIFRPFAFVFFFVVSSSVAQTTSSYYVIVGAFSVEENARRFMEHIQTVDLPSTYAFNPERKVYYVYVRETSNEREAFNTARNMRGEDVLKGAWVFHGSLTGKVFYASSQPRTPKKETTEKKEPAISTYDRPVDTPVTMASQPQNEIAQGSSDTTSQPVTVVSNPVVAEPPKPEGKPFVFKLVNSATGQDVSGEVHLLENERANQYYGYRSNETVYVGAPVNRAGRWYISSQVVGFKPAGRILNYNNPKQSGATIGADEEVIIPIQLTRVKKGDYIELEEVKFMPNSAILLPESERELIELYNMMNENPGYKIRLHGHTNGDESREIIRLGDSQNFFAEDPANVKENVSAKELSKLMAETVSAYLISKGIDESRISVKGWGGIHMIFDPKGGSASKNDRVEVEVVKH